MQIPILSGIYADNTAEFRTSYPRNLVPVPKETGISSGYLRPAEGIVEIGTGPGVCRGGIAWRGALYRVMGSSLVRIDGAGNVTTIGSVGSGGTVSMVYGFDYLAIASDGRLYLYNGTTLARVTDNDLGNALDVVWVDGYFMTTDGQNLVVTELNDPFSVNPLKYGSSEADPDPVIALVKVRNEVYALNRHTIEVFDNVGQTGFPFQRIEGAQIQKGVIGTHACCVVNDQIVFLGGGFNEAPSIYIGANGSTSKIATREIDEILQEYTENELSSALIEERVDRAHEHVLVHLPRQTLVFDLAASRILQRPVWFSLATSLTGDGAYTARHAVWLYDQWNVCHSSTAQFGRLDRSISTHWGAKVGWHFGTQIVYNEGRGAIFHEMELVALTGNVALGENPTIWTQYTVDGETWSVEKPISAGVQGARTKRLVWLQQGHMQNWRSQRFRGTSDAHIAVSRLEARVEPLAF